MADLISDVQPSSLLEFVGFLQKCRDRAGCLTVPNDIERGVTKYLNRHPLISLSDVAQLVTAIDDDRASICRRLDLRTFTIVYLIINRSEEGPAYQRGLSLLAESFFNPPSTLSKEGTSLFKKKVNIGRENLLYLVKSFTTGDRSQLTRRWIGVLALELIRGCSQNKELILNQSENTWRSMQKVILCEGCEVLKLVAGLIVREVWPAGPPVTDPWFSASDLKIHAKFPKSGSQSSQWILAFESYIYDLITESQISRLRPEVILAYSVSIGDKSYHLDDEDAILVTVSDILHIIIPMSNLAPALYIDIPLSQVGDVTIEKVDFQSQSRSKIVKSLEVLTVCFLKSSSNGFFINAARCVSASIQLTFTSSKDATTIRKSLGGFGPRMIENLRISQSEPINVSQNLYANREGTLREGLESHQGTNSRTSRSTPHLSLPRTDYTKPGNALEWTPGRNNEGRSVSTHNNENVSTACSPIPIQRPNEPLINPVNDLGIFEDQSEGRIDSSTEWRKGARVIDSAPELQSKHYELTGESAMPVRDHTPIKLTTFERDDILYSATPRANESRQPQDRGRDSQCDKSLKLQSAVYKKTASMADSTIDSVGHLQNGEQFISNRMETFRGSSITSRNINNIQAGKRRVSRQDSSSGNVTSPDEGETREPARTEKLSTAHLNETRGCDSKTTTRTKNDGKDDFGILATPQNQQKTKKISLLSKSALQGSNLLKLKYGAKRMTDISSKDQLTLIPENTESELNQVKKVPHNATIKPPVPLESMIDAADKDDTNWDEGLIDDETEPNPPRRKIPCVKQKPKKPLARSRNKDDDAYSVKKGLPGQGRKAKRKAQPVPKTMRIADMAVNQDLQNLAHSNARRDQIKAPLFTPTLGFTEKQSGRDENIPKERVVPVIKMSVESVAEFEPQMFELQSNASRSRASDDPNESDLAAIPLKFDESKYGDGFEGPNIIDGKANQPSINDRGVPSITHTSFLSQACNTYQDETTVENPHAKIPLTLGKSQEEVTNRTTHSRQEDDIDSICGSAPRHNGKRINQEAFNAEEQTFTNANISDATTDGFVADAIIYSVGPKPQEYKTRKGDLKITKSKTRTADSTVLQAHQTISEGSSNDVDGNSANLNARAKPVIATKLEIALASVNSRKAQHLQPGTQIPGRPNEIDFVAKKPILAEEELESKFPNGQGKLVSGTKKVHDETINESTKPDEGQPKNLRNDPSWLSPRNSQPLVQKSHPSIIRISASSEPEASIESGCHDEITFIGQGLLQDGRELEKSVAFGNDLVRAVLQPDLNTASHNSHHSQNSRHCRKRNIDQTPLDTRKRIKSLSAKSSCSALFSSKADAPFTTPKNSSYHNRKTKLISFNSKGPRNQGKIPRSARQSDKVIIPESIHQSNEVPVIPTGRLHEVGSNTCLKRKSMASDEEEDGSPEMILVEKKSRTFAVANTQTKSPEKAGPHQTLVSRDTTSKPSSQNIKVDENGSPMRVASSPLKTIEVAPVFGYTNGEDGAFGTFNDKFIEANLPDKVEKSPKLVRFAKVIPLSNNKHLPSSPNASRIAAGLTAHTAHACGKFINIQTENTVMPVRPLDPFLEPGQDQYHPNTFMNLLRRSSDLDTDKKNSPRVSPKAVDTDKTLVDAESCEEVVRPDSSSAGCSVPDDSSSSTESYSGGSSRSQELVSNDQDLSEEAAWHKALKPHQRYTLDILCEVSHRVVENLVDKETAIDDLVSDYRRGGMRLVDQFKKARQQDLDTFQADINRHNEDLVTTYKNHQSELKADFEMVTALVAKQEKKWKESQEVQQDVQSTLDAALVACMEYASHEGKAITEPDMSF